MPENNNPENKGVSANNIIPQSEKDNSIIDISLFFRNLSKSDKKLFFYLGAMILLMLFMYIAHEHELANCVSYYNEVIKNQSLKWCIDINNIIS